MNKMFFAIFILLTLPRCQPAAESSSFGSRETSISALKRSTQNDSASVLAKQTVRIEIYDP